MKIIFYLISIVILVTIISFAALNNVTLFNYTALGFKPSNTIHLYHISLFKIMMWTFVAGTLIGTFWASAFYNKTQVKLKEYQRKLEKTSVKSSDDSAAISVLKAKIATLEKALESALRQNQE